MAEPGIDAATVAERLRQMARLLDARGLLPKGVDMSGPAVTDRLRTLSTLSDACRRLAQLGAKRP